jgi:hypothetical protein
MMTVAIWDYIGLRHVDAGCRLSPVRMVVLIRLSLRDNGVEATKKIPSVGASVMGLLFAAGLL